MRQWPETCALVGRSIPTFLSRWHRRGDGRKLDVGDESTMVGSGSRPRAILSAGNQSKDGHTGYAEKSLLLSLYIDDYTVVKKIQRSRSIK